MWKTVPIAALAAVAVFGANGDARTFRAASSPCAAPADLPPLVISGSDVIAVDLNPGRLAADDVLVIYDSRFDGWASRRLFARFVLKPSEGPVVYAGQPGTVLAPEPCSDEGAPKAN
ncbi:MAG: hypothetical protein AAFY22_06550 [Pseudomonadota bacterium]